jgi:hypothetical protein
MRAAHLELNLSPISRRILEWENLTPDMDSKALMLCVEHVAVHANKYGDVGFFIKGRMNSWQTCLISRRKSMTCWQCMWNSSMSIILIVFLALQASKHDRKSLYLANFCGETNKKTVQSDGRHGCFTSGWGHCKVRPKFSDEAPGVYVI